ncbi:fructosamine kinase [Coniochaeta sp. 2T2.1]|nr:fructosamine kinase [Coniochaeta sp. 2T2.1]
MSLPPFRPKWDIHGQGPSLDEVIPGIGEEIEVDPNVVAALPRGLSFVKATSHGTSLWCRTAKITTLQSDSTERHLFMKVATGDSGKVVLRGEYEGMSANHNTHPSFCPEPIAWSEYKTTPGTYFFISDFIDMDESNLPDPADFCSNLARLHRESVSPTGKFGFHVVTCNGTTPQKVDWEESWEVFFAEGLRHMLELDVRVNGEQPELVEAIAPVFERVIPQLLRPLQEGSPDPIRPALMHGYMWWGNSAVDRKTGKAVVFDASAFYGHNEYELGNWRPKRSRFGREYFEEYKRHYPPAHPKEEFDDRILLYSMRFDFQLSILFPGSTAEKKTLIDNM